MLRKTILLGIFLIILVNLINAQTQKDLADQHYELALYAYNNDDCKNASVHVSRALDLYTRIVDILGKKKCNELIVEINSCLSLIGDSYYIQALDYYSQGDSYLSSGDYRGAKEQFETALSFVYDANGSYQCMIPVDPEKTGKIDIEYQNISEKIRECELMRADELYETAEGYFDVNDLINARKFTEDAHTLYTLYNDEEGINEAMKFLKRIDDKIASLTLYANDLYDRGVGAYKSANCTNNGYFDAINHFEEAKNLYNLLQKIERMGDCDDNIGQINERLKDCVYELRKQANEYYEDANTHRRLQEYQEAVEDANKAKNLFQLVYSLTGDRSDERRIDDCDHLLKEIYRRLGVLDELEFARECLDNATELFRIAEYEKADILADKAKEIFVKHEDYEWLTYAKRLKDQINGMFEVIIEAESHYNRSLSYYSVADYENATIYVGTARELYVTTGRTQEIAMCDSTLEDIHAGNETKNEANRYYEEAMIYLNSRDYELSYYNADRAKKLYEKINYVEGVKKAEELLEGVPERSIPMTHVIIVPLVIVTILIITFMWFREKISRGEKEEEDEKREEKEAEERKRARIEAERGRREKEKEGLERERKRLRTILKEEKKTIDTEKKVE